LAVAAVVVVGVVLGIGVFLATRPFQPPVEDSFADFSGTFFVPVDGQGLTDRDSARSQRVVYTFPGGDTLTATTQVPAMTPEEARTVDDPWKIPATATVRYGIYSAGVYVDRLVYAFVTPGCLPYSIGPGMTPPPPPPDCHVWTIVNANTGARLEARNGPAP
jgi:hypothetical protein